MVKIPYFKIMLLLFLRDRRASTLLEYAMIGALISTAAIGAIGLLGDELPRFFLSVASQLSSANAKNLTP